LAGCLLFFFSSSSRHTSSLRDWSSDVCSSDLSVSANPTALARIGVVVIASQPFSVSQTGATCTYALTLINRTHGAGVETGSVDKSEERRVGKECRTRWRWDSKKKESNV